MIGRALTKEDDENLSMVSCPMADKCFDGSRREERLLVVQGAKVRGGRRGEAKWSRANVWG